MGVQLYSDALGLAILQQANRYLYWTPTTVQWLLLVAARGRCRRHVRIALLRGRRTVGDRLAAALALGIVAWNLTGEIGAAAGTNSIGRTLAATLAAPSRGSTTSPTASRRSTSAQGQLDQDPEWMLEFWNRSIDHVGSLDGTLGGPGPAGQPEHHASGRSTGPPTPRIPARCRYAVEDWPCVDFAGTLRATHLYNAGRRCCKQWRLIQLTHPNRLRAVCSGIYPDGWTGAADSTYFRF